MMKEFEVVLTDGPEGECEIIEAEYFSVGSSGELTFWVTTHAVRALAPGTWVDVCLKGD